MCSIGEVGCWQSCGWRAMKHVGASLFFPSPHLNYVSFHLRCRCSPPDSCRSDAFVFLLASFSLSPRSYSPITCASLLHSLGNSGLRTSLNNTCTASLRRPSTRLKSIFPTQYSDSRPFRRGRLPHAQGEFDCRSCTTTARVGMEGRKEASSLDLCSAQWCPRTAPISLLSPLPNSAPPPTDRRDREEEGRRVAQSNSLFSSSAAPALPPTWLRRILSFSLLRSSAAPPCPPTYGAIHRQRAINRTGAGVGGRARAPVSNA